MKPTLMRILGLDVGDRRIGVAISDPVGLTAQPLMVIERRSGEADIRAVRMIVTEYDVGSIIVGLPLTMRGVEGPQAKKVMGFADSLRRGLSLPVHLLDERLTTMQGQRVLRETGASRAKRRLVIDQVAAQLILQHFLETQR